MRRFAALLLASAGPLAAAPAAHAGPPTVAIFDFELVNTSPAPSTPAEITRLYGLDRQLRDLLAADGRLTPVDDTAQRQAIARGPSIRGCNGCELDAARQAGAEVAAYGWVQKVSNLILNVNLVIEDAATGRKLKAGSVDIRGNTDESWQRGLRYLIEERLYRNDAP